MKSTLRALIIEDSERDAELLRRHLVRAGYELIFDQVETSAAMKAALETEKWDVILSDYAMPRFSALAALALLKEMGSDIPFIIISGTIGEALAVEAMLAGAHDYLMKDNLTRLAPAIQRELHEADNRRARRQAEESLKASETELRALFAAMNDVILVFDAEGRYLKTAPTHPSHIYKPADDPVGKTLHDVFPKAKADFFLEHIRRALEEGQMHTVEYSLPIDGREVYFDGSVSPMSNDSVIWIARDITERKRAEAENAQLIAQIESQRKRLNNIVTSVPGVVWEAWGHPDAATQSIDYVSDYVETMLGYSVGEWLSTPNFWLTIVHPDDKERMARDSAASFARGEPGRFEFRWIAKDGHVVWIESHSAAITNDEGRPVGLRGVNIDISERKRVEEALRQREEQLRQSQKMEAIGTLAGGIAHDFNNSLGVIMGYSELAQWDLPTDHAAHAHLAQIQKASNRAKDLVQQILTFSRQQEHERKPIRLQPILEEALKLLRATIPSTVEIRQQLDPQAPTVLGDPTQIHQVIMNLATNAWHATSEQGGILEVTLSSVDVDADYANTHADLHEGKHLRLVVRDNGHGIDQDTLGRIYDPFFTTKAPGEGTGLGLAVVHGVVKKHQGSISVSSEPGKGTTFSLYFPVQESEAGPVEPTSAAMVDGSGASILFIDDEEPLAVLGKKMLERMGHQVTIQTGSVEALEVFRAQPDQFDLVITDQTMPRLSGVELAKTLLEIRPHLPILLTTGYSGTISSEEVQAIGIRELLMKPNTAQSLEEAINRVLIDVRKE